jgi:hypothetical protein
MFCLAVRSFLRVVQFFGSKNFGKRGRTWFGLHLCTPLVEASQTLMAGRKKFTKKHKIGNYQLL